MPILPQSPHKENAGRQVTPHCFNSWYGLTQPFRLTYKMCLLIQLMFSEALGQCKQYANSGAPATQETSGQTRVNHGDCIECVQGYSLQDKECVAEQGFNLAKLPGLIAVISIAGCIMMCLIAHLIQKRCRQLKKKSQQERASNLTPVDAHTNTLSHQQWSCRISRLCSFKFFTPSQRDQKLQEIARSSLAPPVVPYQVSQPELKEFTESKPPIPLPAPVHAEDNPAIQSIQFLDVAENSERPNMGVVDDVMIVLANPPAQVIIQTDDIEEKLKEEIAANQQNSEPLGKMSARKDGYDHEEDRTKLASDFTKASSQQTSAFGHPQRVDEKQTVGQAAAVPREESWKAEEA